MSSRSRIDWGDGARWLISGVVVLFAHAAAGAILANLADPISAGQPEAAIVIDLAPIAAAPPEAQQDMPPGPLAEQVDAPPEVKPEEVPEKAPDEPQLAEETPVDRLQETPVEVKVAELTPLEEKIETSPVETPPQEQPLVEQAPLAPKPEVTASLPVQKPPPPPPPKKKTPPKRPLSLAAAPTSAPNVDTRVTAPWQGMPSPNARQVAARWNSMISAALERAKRYPSDAKSRNEQGTAVVSFSIDRSGRVVSSRLARSSGHAALDQETMATVARASLPPAPAGHPGTQFSFSVPIRFNIR